MKSVRGLSEQEVKQSIEEMGTNALSKRPRKTFLQKYFEKFDDPIIIILLVALGVNVVFTFFGKVDWFECLGIFLSVLIATVVGALSEYKNEEQFQNIQEQASNIRCKVYRDGVLFDLGIEEIVTGDYVLLQTGDLIPADGKVYDGSISVDQSALTGESKEVKKLSRAQGNEAESKTVDFWDDSSLFRGTVVCNGQCILRVTCVGDKTVYGRMSFDTKEDERQSPLQVKLSALAKKISVFGYIGAFLVVAIYMFNQIFARGVSLAEAGVYFSDGFQVFSDLIQALIMGITVIVVCVPEGLPLMIAIVCSLNMKKMMKENVLVRKLIGIETAGNIDILFTDKTGTITCGRLKATSFTDGAGKMTTDFSTLSHEIKELLGVSVVYNSAAFLSDGKAIGGNATERALLEMSLEFGIKVPQLTVKNEELFSSDRKYSAAEVEGIFSGVLVKGAPEKILEKCKYFYGGNGEKIVLENKQTLSDAITALAEKSIRVLAVATGESFEKDILPDDLTLVGLIGIRDELRMGVLASVREMKRAGIQVVMITGDKKETALAIAKESGITGSPEDLVITSEELGEMDDAELGRVLPRLRVVARALPTDKSRLVRVAQNQGMVAGMTGDGANDLTALRTADVGFAMGGGAEIAKEAGDIVILDDNFSSIKKAVLYGRTIYKSIKKFIMFQMTINIAAVAVNILGPIVGIDKPLGITQMFWVNLVMDTLAAIAFGGEAALPRYLLEKPIRRKTDIIDKNMWSGIIINSLFISSVSLFMFVSQDLHYAFRSAQADKIFYTGYFSYFVFSCIFNAFNTRTDSIDLADHISLNKPFLFIILLICVVQVLMTYFGGAVLGTAGLAIDEWVVVIVMALLIIPVDILRKLVLNRF